MQKIFLSITGAALLLLGCGGLTFILEPSPTIMLEPTPTASPLPSPTQIATVTPILFPTNTPTPTPSETPLPTFTFTPTATLEPQWYIQGPGEVIVPILLYHHVALHQSENLYYVSPDAFERQMYVLHEWGYQTISVESLVNAIKQGAELPPKPILLTFDDGSESVYINALPIMQKYNFTGTAYIVYNYVATRNYMNPEQIRGLYASGWEIGSHSLSHADLTERSDRQMDEIVDSRRKLQSLLGVPVLSFSYPFGAYDENSVHYAHYAGYIAAMGLAHEALQGGKNLFYLYRQVVRGSDDLRTFALLLPWREDLDHLPAITIVP
ncbi:MAG: polysaccharide deacetylase family protein [Anaerolineales bacterium]